MTDEQLAFDLGVPDPHPAFARRRRQVELATALELYTELYGGERELYTDHHPDRLWGYGASSVRRSCLERPVELVVLAGGAL